jgi:hypothetical protein
MIYDVNVLDRLDIHFVMETCWDFDDLSEESRRRP